MKKWQLILIIFLCICINAVAHPLKMAYTSVKYNAEKRLFEISHRVFQDDFELTLRNNYNYYLGDVFVNQHKKQTQTIVNTFFNTNFSLTLNKTKMKLHYVKTEQKNQMGIIVYYETDRINISDLKTVTIYNSIMMESFKEQVNMFGLNINNEIKRTLKFELNKTSASIQL